MKITLGMLVKDEVDSVKKLVKQALPHIDRVVLTVSDEKAFRTLQQSIRDKSVHIYYREWTDRFDEARNDNMSHVQTDYYFWLDADDEFDFSQIPLIRQVLKEVDVVWLPYHYDHDERGNLIVEHWRERFIPMNRGFHWRGWVHENCLTEEPITSQRLNIPVIHHSTHRKDSEERNQRILVKAWDETKDPRYLHYLGLSFFATHQWEKAIQTLSEYIKVGGWDEEIYRSLLRMGESASRLGRFDDAQQYTLQAMGLLPEYPQAYFNVAEFEYLRDNWKGALEWLKVAFSKPQPETAAIVDPTVPDKARLIGAICEFKLGNAREASELIKMVRTVNTEDLPEIFEYQASVERAAAILPALKKHYKNPAFLWEDLHDEIKYDNKFRKFRESVTEPKVWPKNSLVIFCGRGYEEWGPHTLDKGMGGAEEAIVYLSEELGGLGYDVTVFGEISKPMQFKNVRWLPWTHIDKRDEFHNLVIWRYPQFVPQFKAVKKFVDMHDLMPKKFVKPYQNTTYLFKSQWHKDQYPDITDYKIIGNGINLDQFKKEKK